MGMKGASSVSQRLLQKLELPADFRAISTLEEEALIVKAVAGVDSEMLNLFRAYGSKDLLTFVRFARALAGRDAV